MRCLRVNTIYYKEPRRMLTHILLINLIKYMRTMILIFVLMYTYILAPTN